MIDIHSIASEGLRRVVFHLNAGVRLLRTATREISLHALAYVALAALSISTATVQPNAAAVWIPSGYAIGLLIVRGIAFWPAIAFGAFAFNLAVNIGAEANPSLASAIVIALAVAIGNTAEAVLGGAIARRFAAGAHYLFRVRSTAVFILLVATLPPLVSTAVGVSVSQWGDMRPNTSLPEVVATWYIGNCVGILVFCGVTVLALTRRFQAPSHAKITEATALALVIGFVGQAICGAYLADWLDEWPKSYMVIPLLFWACFRFGSAGGLLSIAFVTLIAVIGTLSGFTVFPSPSVSRSLIFLQVFLGMLAVMVLSTTAALAEAKALRTSLEDRVRMRTREIERLLRAREVFTVLVAHDLQSPIYGVRNALRVARAGVEKGLIDPQELASAFIVIDKTCTTLAERVTSLLDQSRDAVAPTDALGRAPLVTILGKIASAHQATLRLPGAGPDALSKARLVYEGDRHLTVDWPAAIEHILDALIDNALKYSPAGKPIQISAFRHGGTIEIAVTDEGPGLRDANAASLFRPRRRSEPDPNYPGAGLGLYLASEQAHEIGARLSYAPAHPKGSIFRIIIGA